VKPCPEGGGGRKRGPGAFREKVTALLEMRFENLILTEEKRGRAPMFFARRRKAGTTKPRARCEAQRSRATWGRGRPRGSRKKKGPAANSTLHEEEKKQGPTAPGKRLAEGRLLKGERGKGGCRLENFLPFPTLNRGVPAYVDRGEKKENKLSSGSEG